MHPPPVSAHGWHPRHEASLAHRMVEPEVFRKQMRRIEVQHFWHFGLFGARQTPTLSLATLYHSRDFVGNTILSRNRGITWRRLHRFENRKSHRWFVGVDANHEVKPNKGPWEQFQPWHFTGSIASTMPLTHAAVFNPELESPTCAVWVARARVNTAATWANPITDLWHTEHT